MTYLVSVLMPVYNERPEFLKIAIESILLQDYGNLELVIVDDGSSFIETINLINHFAERDPRVRVYHESHHGLTETLNFGLSLCKGLFIARQDSDDWSEPSRISRQVEVLIANPDVMLVGSFINLCGYNGNVLWSVNYPTEHSDVLSTFRSKNSFAHGSVIFRKEIITIIGGYNEIFDGAEDYDLFWRISKAYKSINIPDILYNHRRSGNSVTAQKAGRQLRLVEIIRYLNSSEGVGRNYVDAQEYVESKLINFNFIEYTKRKNCEHLTLSGLYIKSIFGFLKLIWEYPLSIPSYVSFFRTIIFILCPPIRKALFTN